MKKIFGSIAKTEAQDDGTIKVWGYASSAEVDSDGETILPSAIDNALGDYMKFGAVREMHQPLAAGTAIEASVQEDGRTWFGAHIVDPIAVKKIQTEVYKGFSIGGKVLARDPLNKTVITELKLVEVSLVDRPANPEAVFTMYKADTTDPKPTDAPAEGGEVSTTSESTEVSTEVPAAEPTAKAEGVSFKKGMSQVSQFAYLLRDLSWLVEDTAWEAEYEADNSPIPAALIAWIAQGAVIFEAMAKEEIDEMINMLNERVSNLPAVIQLNDKGGDLQKSETIEKAGAKFSKANKAALAALHKMVSDCNEGFTKLGYADAEEEETEEEASKSDDADDLAKANVTDELNKAHNENALLKAELDALKKQPAPAVIALNSSAVAVEKSADSTQTSDDLGKAEVIPPEGTEARALYEIKKAHKAGGTRLA